VRVYGIPKERIQVIYNGVDRRFRPLSPAKVQDFKSRKGLPDAFYYYHGTLEPRKNVGGLIRAYAQLPASLRGRMPLIISGALGWLYEPVLELAHSLAGDIRFVGYIDDEELPLWYNSASVFVFPSLYEGFGLPPLEAMACGLPTIVSNRGSLPEIVADGAVIADPLNTELLANEMARLTESQNVRDMRDRGIMRAAAFDWRRTARQVERVYADFAEVS
jgi:glycosyltransferase involved in cell wall biosynthesis